LNKVEPLEAELRAFLDAVTNGTSPAVTGMDALRALALVQLIIASAEAGQVLHFREQVKARGWTDILALNG
jgi:predicted dehydrogenase